MAKGMLGSTVQKKENGKGKKLNSELVGHRKDANINSKKMSEEVECGG